MSILELGPIIFGGTPGIIAYLRRKKLLSSHKDCSACGIPMREVKRRDVTDGVSWWCPQCKTRKSIRDKSFFSKSRLPLLKWLLMFYLWAWQHPVSDAADQINIDRQTAIDIYQWLREVCSQSLIQTRIVLGGPGTIVHVDESLFRHKPKVSFVFAIIKKKKFVTE